MKPQYERYDNSVFDVTGTGTAETNGSRGGNARGPSHKCPKCGLRKEVEVTSRLIILSKQGANEPSGSVNFCAISPTWLLMGLIFPTFLQRDQAKTGDRLALSDCHVYSLI